MRPYRFIGVSMAVFLMFMFQAAAHSAVINEVEPNDTFGAPQDINLPATGGVVAIKGLPSIGVDGNLDFYRFTVPDGAFVIFDIDLGDTGDDSFDSYLVLLDSSGTLIDTQDDDYDDPGSRDGDLDSKLYHYFPQGGTFYIVVSYCCDSTVLDGVF